MKYSNLHLTQLTREDAMMTCGPYYYLVSNNSTSHTAFRRRESLLQWLFERGLTIDEDLAPEGEFKTMKINGEYEKVMHMSYDEFYSLPALFDSRALSNGDYTLSRITENNGFRIEHTLNPNCSYRPKFDYNESRAMFG